MSHISLKYGRLLGRKKSDINETLNTYLFRSEFLQQTSQAEIINLIHSDIKHKDTADADNHIHQKRTQHKLQKAT